MSGSSIKVVRSSERGSWTPLVDPPGEAGTGGAETTAFTSVDGAFTVGLWTREPDTWSFERPYDEVALILEGSAEMEADDGTVHAARARHRRRDAERREGDVADRRDPHEVLRDRRGRNGRRHPDPDGRLPHRADSSGSVIPTEPGDPNEPGEETVMFRSIDGRASVGLWRRVPETGPMDLSAYHEVACLLRGEVDVAVEGGEVLSVGPGDVLVTPRGSRAEWRARSRP